MKAILVLNDGETWTNVDGCVLAVVSEAQMDALMEGVKPMDLGLQTFSTVVLREDDAPLRTRGWKD